MPSFLIRNIRIVEPGLRIRPGDVLIRDGRIAAFGSIPPAALSTDEERRVIDGEGRLLTPGLIDVHTHGVLRHFYANGPETLQAAAHELGRFGVTTIVPTIVPQIADGWLDNLRELAEALPSIEGVCMPGLHIEGPFMAVGGAACPTLPGDTALLDRIIDACRDRLLIMSVSPDTPEVIPVIRRLREQGVVVFLTHTRADVEQTEAAIEAGAIHATHFYDVFHAPRETDPGVRPVGAVEVILGDARTSVDFIADGVHVHPAAIRSTVVAKTWEKVLLITDSNIGAGLPDGVYDTPWGYPIRVSANNAARHATKGFLAGSALTMDRGMSNLHRWLPLASEQIWAMGTLNPARLLGFAGKGRIERGADADLVLWEDNFKPAITWLSGKITYEKNKN